MAASIGRGAAGSASRKDYYALLGVRVDASFREIGMAYWRLAGERHDQLPLLNEAYEVLSNAGRRLAYDASRRAATCSVHARAAHRKFVAPSGPGGSCMTSPARAMPERQY